MADAIVGGSTVEAAMSQAALPLDDATVAALSKLAATDRLLAQDHEIPAILRALDGRFTRPAPGEIT